MEYLWSRWLHPKKKTKKSLLLCNFFDSFLMYKATCTKSILESKNYIMELWKKSTTCKKKLLLWFRLLNWSLPYRVEWGKKCPFPLTKKRKTVIVNQNSGEREKKFTTQWKIAAEATIHFNLVYAHMCFYHFFLKYVD